MKWIYTLLICPILLSGCSSTRKAAKSAKQESTITTQKTESHEEEKRLTETITGTETNDRTNVVIEFTKTEYADGRTETTAEPTVKQPANDRTATKPPKTEGGIKSVTTGKITIGNNRTETTETTRTESAGKTTGTQTNTEANTESTSEAETEEKRTRKFGLLDWLGLAVIAAGCAAGVVYAARRK